MTVQKCQAGTCEHNAYSIKLRALRKELEALKANQNKLWVQLNKLTMCCDLDEFESSTCELLQSTPKQTLNKIRAEAIRDMSEDIDEYNYGTIQAYANELEG